MSSVRKPLIVDRKTKRFFVLVDPKDGTMFCNSISSEFDLGVGAGNSHDEIAVFTNIADAERAAPYVTEYYQVHVVPKEVAIYLA